MSTAVIVSELYPPAVGGSAVLLGNIYSRLRSSEIVVLTDAGRSAGHPGPPASSVRVVYQPINGRLRGVMSLAALRHHARLALRIRALCGDRPVLVHAARALPEGLAALGCKLLTRAPYAVWCHGEELATALTSRELTLLMRAVYHGAAAVIANSRHTRTLLEGIGVPSGRITIVHPGVDATRFRPDVDGRDRMRHRLAPDADLLVLSVGRLQRRKGHDLAIDALSQLVPDFPKMRYVIIGDGEERVALEARVTARGLGRHVTFVGEMPDADLPACYAACDVFLLPNRVDGADVEGFGIVFLEAAATGKPVIAGKSGGVPDAVADGETGFLVTGTDPTELVNQMRRLAASADLRQRLGAAGRARALREFTWERATTIVADLHARLVA